MNELDFQYLEEKIFNYSKPISLNSNVSLGRLESRKFRNGIEIKKDNVVIDGNGHTIDAKGKARVFDIYGNNVTLKNINFKNGFHEEYGGAVRNAGRCKLINCTFEDNHAKIDGNAVSNGSEMCVCDCEFSCLKSKRHSCIIPNRFQNSFRKDSRYYECYYNS